MYLYYFEVVVVEMRLRTNNQVCVLNLFSNVSTRSLVLTQMYSSPFRAFPFPLPPPLMLPNTMASHRSSEDQRNSRGESAAGFLYSTPRL